VSVSSEIRGAKPVAGRGQRHQLDSRLSQRRSAKIGAKVFERVLRLVLEKPDEVLNLDPDPITHQQCQEC
jgi:hypothetical protein